MDRLFGLLPKVLSKRGLTDHAMGALVIYRATSWLTTALGDGLTASARPTTLKDGVLTIECDHSIALQECRNVSENLREYLSRECTFARIREIRVLRT